MSNEERMSRMENQIIELSLAVSSLITTSNRYQDNFLVLVNEIRDMKVEIRDLRADFLEMQSEVRGLQTENRRILEEMERRRDEGNS